MEQASVSRDVLVIIKEYSLKDCSSYEGETNVSFSLACVSTGCLDSSVLLPIARNRRCRLK